VRLGLLNSGGTQDLIVHVIAKSRYELANSPNVLVPTNIDVRTRAQPQFGGFYKELLTRTFAKHPKAAITEFAWQGALPPPTEMVSGGIYGVTCDPCPPPHPVDNPLARYLGVNLLPRIKTDEGIAAFASAATVTRLHLRYTKDSAPDDLVFKIADPIHGGIPEVKVAGPAKTNRFQGRYVMWVQGCGSGGGMFSPPPTLSGPSATSTKLIDPFEQIVVKDVPELDVKAVPLDKDAKPLPYTGPSLRNFAPPPPPPRPTVKVLDVQVNGALDKEIVKRIVLRNRGQVQFCFERELLRNPGIGGKVVLQMVIAGNGSVTASKLNQGLGVSAVDDCLSNRARTWQFPAHEGNATATVQMVFAAPQ
jgi:hypothetical protein